MGWEDRDYYREQPNFGSRLGRGSMVTWLLVANCLVFVWDAIFGGSMRGSGAALAPWWYFSFEKAVAGGQVWRLLTFQFIHADFLHLLFNMIGLYFFGPMLERWWGGRRFLAFYLLCGVSGAVVYLVLAMVPGLLPGGLGAMLVGASGGLFGVLAGCAVVAPRQTVMLLFPPIPMQMRTLVLIFLGIAALKVLIGHANAGGEAAHLGGAALGFALVRRPRLLGWADGLAPGAVRGRAKETWLQRKRRETLAREAELDRVLAKVKEKGLHTLSRREKKVLQQATNDRRRE